MKKILIPIDGTERSQKAFDLVKEMYSPKEVDISIVMVREDVDSFQSIHDLDYAKPVFANGTSSGNLMIVNEGVNRYPQIVEITRDDTGEVVYKSGAIPVGSKIEAAKLDVPLSAGTYACTAIFHNIDPDTGLSLGCAGAVISITVLE